MRHSSIAQKSEYGFLQGLRDSTPIGLGYLSVAFGFGVSAVADGIPALVAVIISLTNMTSAGQVAGVAVMATGGGLIEMALTQLTINLRYSLMSISLTQHFDSSMNGIRRALVGFGITDEIYAVAASKPGTVGARYMYGLISFPYVSWSLGTLLGAVAGNILPSSLKNALGIAIFGMFVAIVIPPAKHDRGTAVAALCAAALSCLIAFVPLFDFITPGFSIIICAIAASALAALLFPVAGEGDGSGEYVSNRSADSADSREPEVHHD
ncbi:MAG: AzlC family ABC transporter permease [Eubacteriales bacterium]|nr:AzlC family ABC transporter permease [Eubacteriales bacterium]